MIELRVITIEDVRFVEIYFALTLICTSTYEGIFYIPSKVRMTKVRRYEGISYVDDRFRESLMKEKPPGPAAAF